MPTEVEVSKVKTRDVLIPGKRKRAEDLVCAKFEETK